MKLFFFTFLLLGISPLINLFQAQNPSMCFTENNGQWDEQILFKTKLDGGSLFIEKKGLTFNFYDKKKFRALHHGGFLKGVAKDFDVKFHAYKIHFENSNANPTIEKVKEVSAYENFFLGADQNKWKSNVKSFYHVFLREIYNGVDYEITSLPHGLKYNFHVKPNTDPSLVRLRYEGVNDIKLVNGALFLMLSVNEVIEQKPYAYQIVNGKKVEVVCNYNLKNSILNFVFPNGYDRNYELIIDPVLVFAAQSGSTSDNFGMTATYDSQGNLYSGGTTFGNGYPVTTGAFSTSFSGLANDIVITKYNSTGTNLLFSTYLGGSQNEIISSMVVDGNNNLCFYGATGSTDFPVNLASYDPTFNSGAPINFIFNGTSFANGTDICVGKLNSSGTSLLGCTYLGGSDNDGLNHVNHLSLIPNTNVFEFQTDSLQFNYGDQYRGEIQVDLLNNIYITSSTRSTDFPVVNGYDNSLGGKQDAIIVKFNSALTQLIFSTFLGGSKNDCGNALIVTSQSEVFVTGGTCSSDFPISVGANSTVYNGGKADGFITHFNTSGNQIIHSTFVGTTNYDQSYCIQTNKYNDIYVLGQSLGNMPIVNSGTIVPYGNAGSHQFITGYTKDLSTKKMSTVFGSSTTSVDISPSAFGLDKCNNIYVSGWGGSIINGSPMNGMPLFLPTQSTTDGYDFYLMTLDSSASSLMYGSYFGGSVSQEHVDGGTSRIDKMGTFYQSVCAGCGGNDDFPVTTGAWPNSPSNPNHSTNCNNGTFKIASQYAFTSSNINSNVSTGCAPLTVSFTNSSTNFTTYTWYLTSGITNSITSNPVITFTAPGMYTVSLVVKNPFSCNKRDSSFTYINVISGGGSTMLISPSNTLLCIGESGTLSASGATSYSWSTGSSSPSLVITPSVTTVYTVFGTGLNGCESNVTITQIVDNCTSVEEQMIESQDFIIYPNPMKEVLTISSVHLIKTVKLFNAYGALVLEIQEPHSRIVELNVRSIRPGLYIVDLYFKNTSVSIKKVLKIE
jgi:PKD repeat protein